MSLEIKVDILVKKLTAIHKNLKKSPNRKFLKTTLVNKLRESKIIHDKLLELLEEDKFLVTAVRKIYSELTDFINCRLELDTHLIKFKTVAQAILFAIKLNKVIQVKMANNLEIIKVIGSLVPSYDGSTEKLDSVVAALTAINTLINDDNRALAIQVVLSKLEGKARSAVGQNPADITTIIDRLKQKCFKPDQPDVIIAKLNATRQTNELETFTNQIERLALELEKAYIAEGIPIDAATKISTKAAVKSLTAGIKNNETKLILKAGQFETLSAAVGKAAENESTEKPQNVYQIQTRFSGRGRGNGQGNGRGNWRGNRGYHNQTQRNYPNYQNSTYSNYQTNSYPQQRGNNNRGRGYQRHPQQRRNWPQQGNFNPNYAMFYANTDQNQQQNPNNMIQQQSNHQIPNQPQAQSLYSQQASPTTQQMANFLGSQYGARLQ